MSPWIKVDRNPFRISGWDDNGLSLLQSALKLETGVLRIILQYTSRMGTQVTYLFSPLL